MKKLSAYRYLMGVFESLSHSLGYNKVENLTEQRKASNRGIQNVAK